MSRSWINHIVFFTGRVLGQLLYIDIYQVVVLSFLPLYHSRRWFDIVVTACYNICYGRVYCSRSNVFILVPSS